MNLTELATAIDSHLVGWTPALIIRDNEPAETDGVDDFIRLTIDGGQGFISRRTGMLSVRGNYLRHPLFMRFAVHTKMNDGTYRSDALCQAILDHWHYAQINPFLVLDQVSISRIGEQRPHYVRNVDVTGFRDERRP